MGLSIKSRFENIKGIGRYDWENAADEDYDMICHYLARFVYRLYGKTFINQWVEKNKGQTFLDLFTASDAAYTTMIIEGNQEVWDQVDKISRMEPSEQAKFKAKNRMKLSVEEQKKYIKKTGKFTKRRFKAVYLESNTTKEGKLFYKDQYYQWRTVMRNQYVMEKLAVVWDDHVKNSSFGHHWLSAEKKMKKVNHDDDGEEGVIFPLSLPGDDDFEADRPWYKKAERDDIRYESDGESEEEGSGTGESGDGDDVSNDGESEEEDNAIDSQITHNRFSYREMNKDITKAGRRKKRKRPARVSTDGNNERKSGENIEV